MALTHIERFARDIARLLCDRLTVEYAQPEGLARVSFGGRQVLVPVDNLASKRTTLGAVERAVHEVLGLAPPEPGPLERARDSVIIQNADGFRARLVAPDGPDGERWDPQQWHGSYRIQHDLDGRSRWYEFVQLPDEPDGTRVFGWLQIPELPRMEGP